MGGRGEFRTLDGKGYVEPGDIWVCPAGEPHEYWADGPWKILFFHIRQPSHGFGNSLDHEQWGHSRSSGQLENAMVWLINEYQFELSHSRELYHHYASIIRLSLDRELRGLAIPMQTRTHKMLDGLWQEVNESLAMPWSLHGLAQRMHVSTAQLRRIVQAHHGVAPMEMVQRLRIRKAQQLLRTTKDSLDQIAERVGYNSPFSFSRAFKKATGISPKSYREKALNYT
ncbi:MAG: AraC family transcriptional regulator [Verrucomicrobia bacterium]|nr:AraC family transcriptional regulator [Verrucomicrobiota bacterium]